MAVPLDFLPRSLRKALMKFQKDGVRFGIEKEGRCLIGDEMGLGKTLQALSIAFYYKEQWPLLIVVPASMRLPWVDEIEKWLPEIQPEEINLIKNSADIAALSTAKINIISYGLLSFGGGNFATGLIKSLESANFGVAILDESHMVKNRQATRTKRIEKMMKKIKRVILLTGTPSLARPEELYSQINIIRPGIAGDWRSFGHRYCDGRIILQPVKGGKTIQKFDTRGASNLQELHEILKKNVMIRRLKKDVLKQLPPKRRQRIRFEITGDSANKKELEKSLEDFKKVVTRVKCQFSERINDKLVTMNDVNGTISRLFMATGLAKAGAIQQYIENLLDGMENKFIVFCFHLAVIDAVTEILAKRRVKHVRLAGDVPPDLRASYVREFQTDPKCRVAVLSITASCTGLTLTAADHVVFAELHWTPGIIQQAEDRCHRIGQQNAVQIHYLIAKGTFDDVLWSMLSRKLTVTSEALDGKTHLLTADEADREKSDLLSLCKAWIPDDDDDADSNASYLFTPVGQKSGKQPNNNQRDIRRSFAMSSQKEPTCRKKRKVSKYYEEGLVNISDSSDDNEDFKANFRNKRKRKRVDDLGVKDVGLEKHGLAAIEEKAQPLSMTEVGSKGIMSSSKGTVDIDDPTSDIIRSSPCVCARINIEKDTISEFGSLKKGFEDEADFRAKPSGAAAILTDQKTSSNRPVCGKESANQTASKKAETFVSCDEFIATSRVKETTAELNCNNCASNQNRNSSNSTSDTNVDRSGMVRKFAYQGKLGLTDGKQDKLTAVNDDFSMHEHKGELDRVEEPVSQNSAYCSTNVVESCSESSHNTSCSSIESRNREDETEANAGWNCSSCTFLNHTDLEFCEMCEMKKPNMFTRIKARKRKRHRKLACPSDCTESNDVAERKTASRHTENARKIEKGGILRRNIPDDCGGLHPDIAVADGVSLCDRAEKSREYVNVVSTERFCNESNILNSSAPLRNCDDQESNTVLTTNIQNDECHTRGEENSDVKSSRESILNDSQLMQNQSSLACGLAEDKLKTEDRDRQDFDFSIVSEKPSELLHEASPANVDRVSDSTITDSDENDSIMERSSFWQGNSGFDLLNLSESELTTSRCKDDSSGLEIDKNRHESIIMDKSEINECIENPISKASSGLGNRESKVDTGLSQIQHFDDIDMVDDSWNDFDSNLASTSKGDCCNTNRQGSPSPKKHTFGFKSASDLYTEEERKSPKVQTTSSLSSTDHSRYSASKIILNDTHRQTTTNFDDDISKNSLLLNNCTALNEKSSCFNENKDDDIDEFFKDENDDRVLCDGFDSDISVLSSEKSDYGSEEENEYVEPIDLQYKLSFESDRVYLYDEDDLPLNINFQIPEVGFLDPEELPAIFKDPYNMKQLKIFCREWRSLTTTKQRVIRKAGRIFRSPVRLYQELKEIRYNPSKERFTSKQKRNEKVLSIADMIGGKVAEIKKPTRTQRPTKSKQAPSTSIQGKDGSTTEEENSSPNLLQAIDADGNPLCLFCNNIVKNGFRPGSNEAKFCSSVCKEEYQFRCNTKMVRTRLFELQKGVCQLCHLDTYELFQRIKALRKKDRRDVLEKTHFTSLPASMLNNIILSPKEGLFWEADHINAVSEGGGECGLDNYRTLCIPCHKDVTKELMKRLKHKRMIEKSKTEGNSDIKGYFNSAKESKIPSSKKKVVDRCPVTKKLNSDKDGDLRKDNHISGRTDVATNSKVIGHFLFVQDVASSVCKSSSEGNKATKGSAASKTSKSSGVVEASKTSKSSGVTEASKASKSSCVAETSKASKSSGVAETSRASKGSRVAEASKTSKSSGINQAAKASKSSGVAEASRACKGVSVPGALKASKGLASKGFVIAEASKTSKDSSIPEALKASNGFCVTRIPKASKGSCVPQASKSSEGCVDHVVSRACNDSENRQASKAFKTSSLREVSKAGKGSDVHQLSQTCRKQSHVSTDNNLNPDKSQKNCVVRGLSSNENKNDKNLNELEKKSFSFARMATGSTQDVKAADDYIASLIAKSSKRKTTGK